MRISAFQLRQALHRLPDPNSYPQDIVNVRLQSEDNSRQQIRVTFTKRKYVRAQSSWVDWALEVT